MMLRHILGIHIAQVNECVDFKIEKCVCKVRPSASSRTVLFKATEYCVGLRRAIGVNRKLGNSSGVEQGGLSACRISHIRSGTSPAGAT